MEWTVRTRFCIWLPFGELVHHETEVGGPCWKRGPGNAEWWKHRAEVLARYTIPSLLNQKFRFDIFAGIPREAFHIAAPVLSVLLKAGVETVFHPARPNEVYGKSVAEEGIRAAFGNYDNVMFAQIDADDMYLDDALELMAEHTPTPGLLLTCRIGYYWNAAANEMHVYNPGHCTPPFFARVYTRKYLKNPAAYDEQWRFREHHQNLTRAWNRVDINDWRFVLVSHGSNTTSKWETLKKKGSFGPRVDDAERDNVLRRCGQCA